MKPEAKGSADWLTREQLRAHGFPLPKKRLEPAFEPKLDESFYLLHSSLPYDSAGYATRTHGLLAGLRAEGWDALGITRHGYPYDTPRGEAYGPIPETDLIDEVPYHRLSASPETPEKVPLQRYVQDYTDKVVVLAQQKKPFVIHGASNHWNGLAAVSAARALGVSSVYEVRGLWEVTRGSRNPSWMGGRVYKYLAAMEAEAASNADKVIAITPALAEELISRGVDPAKISVVPNGVDTERFAPMKRDAALARKLGLEGKKVLGYVGSILDYEGIDLLVQAASRLAYERDDFAVLLVGDGGERERIKAMVQAEGLVDRVLFTGHVPHGEVESYYSLIDIAPFPRKGLPVTEMVSPLKPLEAMAMGKAVLASNVRAIEEMVQDGSTGLLHQKDDVESLTGQLRLLLDDDGLRLGLGQQARLWVQAERTWQNLAGTITKVYEELGGEPAYPLRGAATAGRPGRG